MSTYAKLRGSSRVGCKVLMKNAMTQHSKNWLESVKFACSTEQSKNGDLSSKKNGMNKLSLQVLPEKVCVVHPKVLNRNTPLSFWVQNLPGNTATSTKALEMHPLAWILCASHTNCKFNDCVTMAWEMLISFPKASPMPSFIKASSYETLQG